MDTWPQNDPSMTSLPERLRARLALAAAHLFWVLPLTLYALTVCRGVGWLDSAMLVNNVFLLKTGSWVNNHNLFLYVGRLWLVLVPLPPALALNLLAALGGALTVHFVFRAGLLLTSNLAASGLGAVALMLSHSLWWHSTSLEVYTLNTFLLALMLFLVIRWSQRGALSDLYAALFVCGLGVSNHVLMGLFAFAFLALLLLRSERQTLWRPGVVGLGFALLLLGSQLWLVQFFRDFVGKLNETQTWPEQTLQVKLDAFRYTLYRATGGRFRELMFDADMPLRKQLLWRVNYGFLLMMNYPSVALPLGGLGLWAFWRAPRHRVAFVFFAVALGVQVLWSANYLIWDMYAFGLPVWVMFGLLVIVGLDWAQRRAGRLWKAVLVLLPTLLVPPLLYAQVAAWSRSEGFWSWYFANDSAAFYDAAEYFANPNKARYRRAEQVVAAYARTLPEGAHLWDSDPKGYYPFRMYYQRVMGHRLDVQSHLIFNGFLDGPKAREHAQQMKEALERGERVFVSSLTHPERAVLAELFLLLDPAGTPPPEVRRMPRREFLQRFPGYQLHPVPLEGLPDISVYELVPR
jgi:hypothetical protein